MRTYEFRLIIECASPGKADLASVEDMLDLTFKELVYDDTFVNALGETQSVTIQVLPN